MSLPEVPKAGVLTMRSVVIALALVLLWVVACCFMAVHPAVHTHQLLMVLGFGAILTIFLLQFPMVFIVSVAVMWGGTCALMYVLADPADKARVAGGVLVSLIAAAPVMGLALWLKLKPLARRELVIVYACVLIAIPWCVSIKAVIESSVANLFELQRKSEPQLYAWAREMPWWGPTVATPPPPRESGSEQAYAQQLGRIQEERNLAARGFTQGNGGLVPWKLWWRPILYWTAMCLAYEAMLMGLLLLFRKRWLEHERLPFVWSQPALEILRDPADKGDRRRRWIMFAIGLGICLPAVVLIGPAGQSLISWGVPPWVGSEGIRGGFDLSNLNLLPKTPLKLWWGPLVLSLLLLFPVDVLMTTALTFIIFNLLGPSLMTAAGLDTGQGVLADFTKWGLRFGGCAGLFIWSVVFALYDWLRHRGNSRQAPSERGDDLPRGLLIAITVGGLAAFVALGYYSTTMIQMLLLTGFVVVYAFAQVRQRAEGMPLTYDNNIASHQMASIQRDYLGDHYNLASKTPGMQITAHSWATHWMQWSFSGQLKSFGPHNMLLEAFKVAHELRVRARPVAVAILATMLIVAAVTPLLYLHLMYTYGYENSYQGNLTTRDSFTQWSGRSARYGLDTTSNTFRLPAGSFLGPYRNIYNAAAGVLIVGLFFYLRREYPRFPFSPVGLVLGAEVWSGMTMPFSPYNIWFTFLAAWIVKVLIFRWLGVRSFRDKVQPALVMVLCGMIFGIILYICRYIAMGMGVLK